MLRLAGYIGSLPTHAAQRTVLTMASALLRGPCRSLDRRSAPELGVHLAWVTDAAEGTLRSSEYKEAGRSLVLAGDCVNGGVALTALERLGADDRELASLNGFFSGVLVDVPADQTIIFTDRYGIERLYCHEAQDGLYFASEAKALLRVLEPTRAFDAEGVAQYLAFGCTLPPRTLFRGIRALPQAARWTWSRRSWERRRYFDWEELEAQPALSVDDFERTYAATFMQILPEYFAAPARVGLALTGGLDTRMIIAARPDWWKEPVAYTYGGKRPTHDVCLARSLAASCGIPHHVIGVDDTFLRDFAVHADQTVFDSDGANGVLGAHESFLSARARLLAPVRLTGVFGGEVLRGVSPWGRLRLLPNLVEPTLRAQSAQWSSGVTPVHPVTAAAFGTTPAALFGSLAACRSWLTFRTPFLDTRLVQLAYRSPRADSANEASAVRMLTKQLPTLPLLPTDRGRRLRGSPITDHVSRALGQFTFKLDYIANDGLPRLFTRFDGLIDRLYHGESPLLGQHKYLRYRRWLRRELAEYARDRTAAARRMPFWNQRVIEDLAERHVNGLDCLTQELNVVLSLEAVDRLLLRPPPAGEEQPRQAEEPSDATTERHA